MIAYLSTALTSVVYYAVVIVWSAVCLTVMVVLFAITAAFDRERVALHVVSRLWARSLFRLNPLWRVKVVGKDNIDPEGVYIVTVNHQSMLDIPLMYFLPRLNFKWVAKREVYKWPVFGIVLWLHGDITVSHGSLRLARDFIAKGKRHLGRGTSVVIFPEGTRSRDGEIHNFKEGAFNLAREAGVALLPCVIDGVKGFIRGWRVQPRTFTVTILPPIPAQTVAQTPSAELMRRDRELSVAALAGVRHPFCNNL